MGVLYNIIFRVTADRVYDYTAVAVYLEGVMGKSVYIRMRRGQRFVEWIYVYIIL